MSAIETIIIGAGQAGLALSRHLTAAGRDHVVLERGRVGERWRSERWDSLALLTPNWANRLPYDDAPSDPHAYASRAEFVATLERPTFSEFSVADSPLVNGVLAEPFVLRDGKLAVPSGPGLGVELDENALARLRRH